MLSVLCAALALAVGLACVAAPWRPGRRADWTEKTRRFVQSYERTSAHAARGAVALEAALTRRDPATGIVRGAEALDLDPPATADRPTTAVLLLHGFAGSRRDFADLGQRLAGAGFHVRLARLPGHATTPDDFAAQTSATLLAGAESEFRALKERYAAVDVVGFSMGGSLAAVLAARMPVRRLVLAAPYFSATQKWFYVLPPETWNDLLCEHVHYVVKPRRGMVNRRSERKSLYSYWMIPTSAVTALTDLGTLAGSSATLGAIRCPVLAVVAAGDDAASPQAAGASLTPMPAPVKRLHTLPRSNHHLFWDYDAETAKEEIVEFLAAPAAEQARNE